MPFGCWRQAVVDREFAELNTQAVPCGPLIRPTGTFSPLGRRGNREVAAYPLRPGGERCRQADEGAGDAKSSL
ncbi:hypothetical protein CO648_05080 [Rhizobium phaseoli]|nr:hypothetical protein CO648_05080 [Rhizobium phaseoli]